MEREECERAAEAFLVEKVRGKGGGGPSVCRPVGLHLLRIDEIAYRVGTELPTPHTIVASNWRVLPLCVRAHVCLYAYGSKWYTSILRWINHSHQLAQLAKLTENEHVE